MSNRVVLTADRTLMSSYNGSMFIGFAACFPRVLPRWLYTRLFCPSQPHKKGRATFAPAGLRKIQSCLIASGIPQEDIIVADPNHLEKAITPDTKAIGITTSDPMGLGPASSTFSSLLGREAYTAYFFRNLVTDPTIRKSHATIIVGGPGAWQLQDDATRAAYGIDCLVEGEGELVAPRLFADAIAGRQLPDRVSGGPVPVSDIPLVAEPTINGTVEISRGCGRGCEFCSPNMRTVRHIPLENIIAEVRLNLRYQSKITLHAEDVLRYNAKGIKPDRDELSRLFKEVSDLAPDVGLSHIALSSALSEPRAIEDISVLVRAGDPTKAVYAQTGIETGSPDLVSKHMKGKAKPFAPEQWPEVVTETMKLLTDNHWVPCGTLVLGMPGEKASDVEKTTELVRNVREFKCLIVPLFFVPLGGLKDSDFFVRKEMLPEHWILLGECIEHDFKWVPLLMDELFSRNRTGGTKSRAFKLASWYLQRRIKPYLETMKEGRDPRSAVEAIEEDQIRPESAEA